MAWGLRARVLAAIGAALPTVAGAQTPNASSPIAAAAPSPVATVASPAIGYVRIPANTPVELEVLAPLSSKTSRIDDFFPIRLAAPILVDGAVILPAGTRGQGQIVHAAKARAMGKAGELILAARSLDCGAVHVVLRGLQLGGAGRSHANAILAGVAVGGLFAAPLMFVSGGEVVVPAGTLAMARSMTAVDLRAVPGGACCPAEPIQPGKSGFNTGRNDQ